MIEFQHVSKTFIDGKQQVKALDDVSLSIGDGDIFGIIGFSGAGKSTLIRLINALEKPTAGKVLVHGTDIASLPFSRLQQERKRIGMIFQQFNLLNSKTVFDNVAIPLVLSGKSKKEIKEKTEELLDFVELSDKASRYPDQLSGGQKQRVGIARALATDPTILLSDEATSALDPETMESILELMQTINKKLHITIVIVTHQIRVIQKICSHVAVMDSGRVVEQGSVFDVFSDPKEAMTKNFVRTVIPDQIPSSVVRQVLSENRNGYKIIRMKFIGPSALGNLIYRLNRTQPVETRILHAAVTELSGQPMGIMILQIVGSDENIAQAIAYAEANHVICEEVNP